MRITLTGLIYEYASGEAARQFTHDLAGVLMIVSGRGPVSVSCSGPPRARSGSFAAAVRGPCCGWPSCCSFASPRVPAGSFWHEAQQNRTVDKFLRRADQLEESGKPSEALVYLDRYLRVRENIDVRVRFAETADRVFSSPLRRLHVMEIYRETWERAPEKIELGIRAGEIAVELARFDDAVTIADQLAESTGSTADDAVEGSSRRQFASRRWPCWDARNAPDIVGSESEWKAIVAAFQEAIRRNPHDIDLAVRLADIDRHRLREPAAPKRQKLADDVIDAMVSRNSDRPEAFLSRYVYRKSLKAAGEPVSPNARRRPRQGDRNRQKDIPTKEQGDVLLYAGQRASTRTTAPRHGSISSRRRACSRRTSAAGCAWASWPPPKGPTRLGLGPSTFGARGSTASATAEIDLVLPLSATLIQLQAVCRRGGKTSPARRGPPTAERAGTQPRRARRHAAPRGAAAAKGNRSGRRHDAARRAARHARRFRQRRLSNSVCRRLDAARRLLCRSAIRRSGGRRV